MHICSYALHMCTHTLYRSGLGYVAKVLQWAKSTSLWDWGPSGPHKPPRHGPFGDHVVMENRIPRGLRRYACHALIRPRNNVACHPLACHVLLRGNMNLLCTALMATLLATQLVETKPRLLVERHVVGEPSAVMGSADYVHMYMHTYAYVCIYVCRSGARNPLS